MLDKGKILNINGELLYEGGFLNSLAYGFGISYYNNSVSYVGQWNQNMYHGHGLLIENDTYKYGLYKDGILIEQIKKIPYDFHKYIKNTLNTQLYDSNINLKNSKDNFKNSKDNFKNYNLKSEKMPWSTNSLITNNSIGNILPPSAPASIPASAPPSVPTSTSLQIVENPFNCKIPTLNYYNLNNRYNLKSEFNPINIR